MIEISENSVQNAVDAAFTNTKKNRYSPIGGREPTAGNFQPQLIVPRQHRDQSRDQSVAAGEEIAEGHCKELLILGEKS